MTAPVESINQGDDLVIGSCNLILCGYLAGSVLSASAQQCAPAAPAPPPLVGTLAGHPDWPAQRDDPYFETHGFFERSIANRVEEFGNLVEVWSTAMRERPRALWMQRVGVKQNSMEARYALNLPHSELQRIRP
jgi:hypothetical protein